MKNSTPERALGNRMLLDTLREAILLYKKEFGENWMDAFRETFKITLQG